MCSLEPLCWYAASKDFLYLANTNDWHAPFSFKVWCFLFYQKICISFNKIHFCVCFLKMFRPLKGWICFILNISHLSVVEGIVFYGLYKSRVLIIPCKADDFCLFGYPILKLIFLLFCGLSLSITLLKLHCQ